MPFGLKVATNPMSPDTPCRPFEWPLRTSGGLAYLTRLTADTPDLTPTDPVITLSQLALRLGVNAETIYDLRMHGRGPRGFRIGRKLLPSSRSRRCARLPPPGEPGRTSEAHAPTGKPATSSKFCWALLFGSARSWRCAGEIVRLRSSVVPALWTDLGLCAVPHLLRPETFRSHNKYLDTELKLSYRVRVDVNVHDPSKMGERVFVAVVK